MALVKCSICIPITCQHLQNKTKQNKTINIETVTNICIYEAVDERERIHFQH